MSGARTNPDIAKTIPSHSCAGSTSIQLFNDGTRWRIVNIYWQHESTDSPIPAKYLGEEK